MADADANKGYLDARNSLRETTKWIVTILGATIVLVIGGGLIAKVSDLDTWRLIVALLALFGLAIACLYPLQAAVDIIAARLVTFRSIAEDGEYEDARDVVDNWIRDYYPPDINTVVTLRAEFDRQTHIVNTRDGEAREEAEGELDELEPRVREVIELANTELLTERFDALVKLMKRALVAVGFCLVIFLVALHHDDPAEKQLVKPMPMAIAWNGDVEAVLKKAGLDEKCYVKTRPDLIQLSEKSGLRAGVLVVPHDLNAGCPPVRITVGNDHQVYSAE
jgi:hypothetical protein